MTHAELLDAKIDLRMVRVTLIHEYDKAVKEKYGMYEAQTLQQDIETLNRVISLIEKELSQGCNLNESTLVNTSTEAYMSFDKAAREA